MSGRKMLALAAFFAFSLGLIGGADARGKRDDDERPVSPFTTTEEGGFTRVTADINGDGAPDIWSYYNAGADIGSDAPARREIDVNRDGRPDMISYYDGADLVREDVDADFDGRVDWVSFYEDGKRVRSEWDTDYDGRPDMFKYYNHGKIERIELDQLLPRDGRIDYWEYYDSGLMKRVGRDLDADGVIDQWGE